MRKADGGAGPPPPGPPRLHQDDDKDEGDEDEDSVRRVKRCQEDEASRPTTKIHEMQRASYWI